MTTGSAFFITTRTKARGRAADRVCPGHGQYVVVQDADLEYDPSEFPRLLQPVLSGKADVVFGSRFCSSEHHRVLYFWHSVGNKFLTLVSNMFTNLNVTDMETCYKLFRRDVIQDIPIEENRFGFEPEITAKLSRYRLNGQPLRIYEIGISYHGRTYQEGKKIGWKDGVRAVVHREIQLAIITRHRPLARFDFGCVLLYSRELAGSLVRFLRLGRFAARISRCQRNDLTSVLISPWIGMGVVLGVLQIWHLFLPVGTWAFSLVFAVGLLSAALLARRPCQISLRSFVGILWRPRSQFWFVFGS